MSKEFPCFFPTIFFSPQYSITYHQSIVSVFSLISNNGRFFSYVNQLGCKFYVRFPIRIPRRGNFTFFQLLNLFNGLSCEFICFYLQFKVANDNRTGSWCCQTRCEKLFYQPCQCYYLLMIITNCYVFCVTLLY